MKIERTKDGLQRDVTPETWAAMSSRGDARKWRILKKDVAPPSEIVSMVDAVKKKKKADAESIGNDEENE